MRRQCPYFEGCGFASAARAGHAAAATGAGGAAQEVFARDGGGAVDAARSGEARHALPHGAPPRGTQGACEQQRRIHGETVEIPDEAQPQEASRRKRVGSPPEKPPPPPPPFLFRRRHTTAFHESQHVVVTQNDDGRTKTRASAGITLFFVRVTNSLHCAWCFSSERVRHS